MKHYTEMKLILIKQEILNKHTTKQTSKHAYERKLN